LEEKMAAKKKQIKKPANFKLAPFHLFILMMVLTAIFCALLMV